MAGKLEETILPSCLHLLKSVLIGVAMHRLTDLEDQNTVEDEVFGIANEVTTYGLPQQNIDTCRLVEIISTSAEVVTVPRVHWQRQ